MDSWSVVDSLFSALADVVLGRRELDVEALLDAAQAMTTHFCGSALAGVARSAGCGVNEAAESDPIEIKQHHNTVKMPL